MSHKYNTTDLHPENWNQEFSTALFALRDFINREGDEALFAPGNAPMIRTLAKYSPPELLNDTKELLRQLNYFEASTAMKRIAAEHGEEALADPENADLLIKMMLNAPPELMEAMEEEAKAMDLLPPTTHVDVNGQPVYSQEQIAKQLGVSVQELEEPLSRMRDQGGAAHTGPVFPVQ